MDGLDDLGLKVHDLQPNANEVDLGDIPLLEADRIDFQDAGKAIAVLLRNRQSPQRQLEAIVGVLHGEAELPDRILEIGLGRLRAERRALDAVAALPRHLEQLLNLGRDLTAVAGRESLRKRRLRVQDHGGIGKQSRGDLLSARRLNPKAGDDQFEVLFEKQRQRFVQAQAQDRLGLGLHFENISWRIRLISGRGEYGWNVSRQHKYESEDRHPYAGVDRLRQMPTAYILSNCLMPHRGVLSSSRGYYTCFVETLE